MVKFNKVLSNNLTKNTKIMHFTHNIDILRKEEGDGQFPIGELVDFIVNIWYTYYRTSYEYLYIILCIVNYEKNIYTMFTPCT